MGTLASNLHERARVIIEEASSLELALANHRWVDGAAVIAKLVEACAACVVELALLDPDASRPLVEQFDATATVLRNQFAPKPDDLGDEAFRGRGSVGDSPSVQKRRM